MALKKVASSLQQTLGNIKMADTTFITGTTITSDWLNEVNDHVHHDTPVVGTTVHNSSVISFTQSGVGSVNRSLQSKLQDTVSVLDFMTASEIADITSYSGAIDVTTKIEAARDATYGKRLYFPAGKYRHTGLGLSTTQPCYWFGDGYSPDGNKGTILFNVGTTNSISLQNIGVANDILHVFQDMLLQGNALSAAGIWGENEHGIRAERVWITGHGTHGVFLTDGWSNKFTQCVIAHNTQHGFFGQNRCNNLTIDRCIINANGTTAGYSNIAFNANVTFENLNVNILNSDFSSVANATGFNIVVTNSWGVRIHGCYSENSGGSAGSLGYFGSNTKSVSIDSCYFQGGSLTLEIGTSHSVTNSIFNKTDIATSLVMNSPAAGDYVANGNEFIAGATATYTGGAGTRRDVYGTTFPVSGTWSLGDICWNINPNGGDTPGWVCVDSAGAGTWNPMSIIPSVVANWADQSATLTPLSSFPTNLWQSPITADRSVTLSTTNAYSGAKFRITRTAGATGAFNLNVGTGPLKALTAGQWCDVEWDGANWVLTAFGSL